LEFAVLPFGPCLLFGACYLVLNSSLDLGACDLPAGKFGASPGDSVLPLPGTSV
jgi:hypothetical protein